MKTAKIYDYEKLNGLLNSDPDHPHIHIVDMPYRIASVWQDHGCEIGIWEKDGQVMAWAIFQPAWWNLDYVVHPLIRGSELEQEIFLWGKEQMLKYSFRTGEEFWGSVEIFEDTPNASRTIKNLEAVGFAPFDWSIYRFELDLAQELSPVPLPKGYKVRSLHGESEVQAYVNLHRSVFDSERMTIAWRKRILQQAAYRPEIDLIAENNKYVPVGFCICWLQEDVGQIEPLGVHPDYQGMGLGKALEHSAYQILKNHGVRLIKVDHASYNENAIALSQKTGFRKSNNALRYYVDVKCP
jgi:ribosomal protein S18 acetylase RimI-like enzyme